MKQWPPTEARALRADTLQLLVRIPTSFCAPPLTEPFHSIRNPSSAPLFVDCLALDWITSGRVVISKLNSATWANLVGGRRAIPWWEVEDVTTSRAKVIWQRGGLLARGFIGLSGTVHLGVLYQRYDGAFATVAAEGKSGWR